MAKAIMIQGTMSNVGKSLLAAALCRIFKQDGYRAAPFKSQNMALNSYITKEGLEMGRAQVVQAEAAGIEPSVHMNPILLKPTTDTGSQVIVHGIPTGTQRAKDYFAMKKKLIPQIMDSYRKLDEKYDIIVIEGAGSPAEINLKQDDIVNMGMAKLAGAPVLLAGDIDRGGVFAQLYGTVSLVTEEEKAMIKGLIINKFRGDGTILEPGVKMLEELCGIPVTGVIPYMNVDIDDEDSLSERLEERNFGEEAPALVDIAVIRFPRMSNFTDCSVFSAMNSASVSASAMKTVQVRYVSRAEDLKTPDFIILPGSKSTIDDLLWMRQNGIEAAVCKLAEKQTPVWGICGGYQMMGEELLDEKQVESRFSRVKGMGLLPLKTEFEEEKIRTRTEGSFGQLEGIFEGLSGKNLSGYEIHMGRTGLNVEGGVLETARMSEDGKPEICRPFVYLFEKEKGKQVKLDGWNRGNIYGSYVHGIFDEEGVAETMITAILKKKGITEAEAKRFDYKAYKEAQYDKLAQTVREHLDMKEIYRILEEGI